ncbi:recombinase [Anaerotignum neopropionicum]|uniref:Recombinase n=1 Tax=Anaerotignum neopropionicum TaxID=36847 RepID=A0A136WDD0_9FIRM|nr:recombinase family protein [Anaerotignum neopropionicum]KXL52494.1 recombinase [Anaerotignum neopropionicum]
MTKRMGIYLRLSDEDGNLKESNSIQGQRELIFHYIMNHNGLTSYEIVEFCDDGYSGTDFYRPGVQELLKEVKNEKIGCIIVKDFSRFGRNYIEVGNYIEQIFPFLGVQFISVNDNYDSSRRSVNGEFTATAFQNLMNDLYSKDLSQKIISARRTKANEGKFITAFAPYGYEKTKEQRLVADKEAAPIVERIFNMALEGTSQVQIARTLNCEKIPSPLLLRKMKKENFFCATVNKKYLWHPGAVSKILKDQRYVGDGVYGKVVPKNVGSSQTKAVPQKNWIIVPNTHGPIVGRETFDLVNAKHKSHQPREKKAPYPLWKKVRCGACNHRIPREISGGKNPQGAAAVFRCTTPRVTEEFGCYKGKIAERRIEEIIQILSNKMLSIIYDGDLQGFLVKQAQGNILIAQANIKQLEVKLKQISLKKMQLYELYKANKLEKESFLNKKMVWEKLYDKTQNTLIVERDKIICLRAKTQNSLDKSLSVNEGVPFQGVTKQLVEAFVVEVFVEKNGSIKVFWRFQDIYQQ